MDPTTRQPFPNDDNSSGPSEERVSSHAGSPGPANPQPAPHLDPVAPLATMFRSLNIDRDASQIPPEILRDLMAAIARWDAIERAGPGNPRGLSPSTGAPTPLTEPETGRLPLPVPPHQNPNPPTGTHTNPLPPQPSAVPRPYAVDNITTDRDALPYIHSTSRIDVNKMLTEAERRIGLFEGATPPRPTYFPPLDPQYQTNLTNLIKHRLLEVRHGRFSGIARDYDNWAEKISDHWAGRQQTWPSFVLPEDLKIAETAELLDDQKRKAWVRIRKMPITDKGKLFTLREYLIYFRTYWGQRRDTNMEEGDWVNLRQTGSAQAFIRTVRQKASELNPPAEMREVVRVIYGGLKKDILNAMAGFPNAPDAHTATEEWLDWIIKLDQATYTSSRQRGRLNAVGTEDDDDDSSDTDPDTDTDDNDDLPADVVNAIRVLKNRGKRSNPKKTKKNKGKSRKRTEGRHGSSRSRSPSPEKTRKCYYCQEPGHFARNCSKKKEDKRKKQKEKEKKEKKDAKKKDPSSDDSSSSSKN